MNDELQTLSNQLDEERKHFLETFDSYLKDIALENRVLDECLKNQVTIQYAFEFCKARAAALLKEAEALRDQYHSYAFTLEMRSNSKPGFTEARKYADCNKDYVEAVKVYNKIFKLDAEVSSVVEAMITRKFVLSNLTNSVINGINKHIL